MQTQESLIFSDQTAVLDRFGCGLPEGGFARVRCDSCGNEYLVAFSCKQRGFCPSCCAKRAALWVEFVREQVIRSVPHRHLQPGKATPVFPDSNKDSQANGPCPLWDTREVAAFLNVKESTIRNWVHIGYIPHIKFRGAVRYQRLAIDQWIKGCVVSEGLPDTGKLSSDILRSRYSRA